MNDPLRPATDGVRPFLAAGRRPGTRLDVPDVVLEDWSVRSYAITGGRSHAVVQLGFESMLQTTAHGVSLQPSLSFERAAIIEMCIAETLSVAELSARLNIPIGVIRVVAADLMSEELLQGFVASKNVADDVSLIARLIAGVRAL